MIRTLIQHPVQILFDLFIAFRRQIVIHHHGPVELEHGILRHPGAEIENAGRRNGGELLHFELRNGVGQKPVAGGVQRLNLILLHGAQKHPAALLLRNERSGKVIAKVDRIAVLVKGPRRKTVENFPVAKREFLHLSSVEINGAGPFPGEIGGVGSVLVFQTLLRHRQKRKKHLLRENRHLPIPRTAAGRNHKITPLIVRMKVFDPMKSRAQLHLAFETAGLGGTDPVVPRIAGNLLTVDQQKGGVGRSGMKGVAPRPADSDESPVQIQRMPGVPELVSSEIKALLPSGAHAKRIAPEPLKLLQGMNGFTFELLVKMQQSGFLFRRRRLHGRIVILQNQLFAGTGIEKRINFSPFPADDRHRTDRSAMIHQPVSGNAIRNKKGQCGGPFLLPLPSDRNLPSEETRRKKVQCRRQQQNRDQIFHIASSRISLLHIPYRTGKKQAVLPLGKEKNPPDCQIVISTGQGTLPRRLLQIPGCKNDPPDHGIGLPLFLVSKTRGGGTGRGQFPNLRAGMEHGFVVALQILIGRRPVAENMGNARMLPEKTGNIVRNRIRDAGIQTPHPPAGGKGVPQCDPVPSERRQSSG